MKKLNLKMLKLEVNNILPYNQLKSIFGGYDGSVASCTADCISGSPGVESTVTCTGNNCVASDFVGCKSDTETKNCPNYP